MIHSSYLLKSNVTHLNFDGSRLESLQTQAALSETEKYTPLERNSIGPTNGLLTRVLQGRAQGREWDTGGTTGREPSSHWGKTALVFGQFHSFLPFGHTWHVGLAGVPAHSCSVDRLNPALSVSPELQLAKPTNPQFVTLAWEKPSRKWPHGVAYRNEVLIIHSSFIHSPQICHKYSLTFTACQALGIHSG